MHLDEQTHECDRTCPKCSAAGTDRLQLVWGHDAASSIRAVVTSNWPLQWPAAELREKILFSRRTRGRRWHWCSIPRMTALGHRVVVLTWRLWSGCTWNACSRVTLHSGRLVYCSHRSPPHAILVARRRSLRSTGWNKWSDRSYPDPLLNRSHAWMIIQHDETRAISRTRYTRIPMKRTHVYTMFTPCLHHDIAKLQFSQSTYLCNGILVF